jgi:hypothetical protein
MSNIINDTTIKKECNAGFHVTQSLTKMIHPELQSLFLAQNQTMLLCLFVLQDLHITPDTQPTET